MHRWRKRILMIGVILAAALAGAVIFFSTRQKLTVEYEDMGQAALPLVRLYYSDTQYNELHGHLQEMDSGTMRDTITPLDAKRQVKLSIEAEGETGQLSYQIRSLDGSHLIEDTAVTQWEGSKDIKTAQISLANLIEEDTEYLLVIHVRHLEQDVCYYSRVIYGQEMKTGELLDFARKFSDMTFDKEQAEDYLVNYIQSDGTMPVDNLNRINIHSQYSMFVWGDLNPVRTGEVRYSITDLSSTQLSVTLYYPVQVTAAGRTATYDIEEYFCVRHRNDKLYLLDYERRMQEDVSLDQNAVTDGVLQLGITPASVQVLQTEKQDIKAFVYDRELWCSKKGSGGEGYSMSRIFSFSDSANTGVLAEYGRHQIELVRVSDQGDIDFLVYGYHNRGLREGSVGISYYRYRSSTNSLSESFYIPVNVGDMVLRANLGSLAYVSDKDLFYFLYGREIYSIDLTNGEKIRMTENAYPGSYAVSADESVIAWQEGEDRERPERICILNMRTGAQSVIPASDGDYLLVKGFIGTDLIYGEGHITDQQTEAGVLILSPLYALDIVDTIEDLRVENHYEMPGVYVTDTAVGNNSVELTRVQKSGDAYAAVDPDMLLLNQSESENKTETVVLKSSVSDVWQREYRLDLGIGQGEDLIFNQTLPKLEVSTSAHQIQLDRGLLGDESYYVYGRGALQSIEGDLPAAINLAFDVMGSVISHQQTYLWSRGARALYKTLSLENEVTDSAGKSLEAALRMMLKLESADYESIDTDLTAGKSPLTILNDRLGKRGADLYGTTVQQVLYYINLGHPVLAVTGSGSALLITGYETTKITVYDPDGGKTYTLTMEEAENAFLESGNNFVSYIE